MANIFWRFEDLWQSPTGDISHAVKLPVGRALRPPEIPVYRPGAVSVSTGKLRRRAQRRRGSQTTARHRRVAFDRYVVNLAALRHITAAWPGVAREYGFPSWPKLKGHVESLTPCFRRPNNSPRRFAFAETAKLKENDKTAID